jgi:hypothetical protein
MAIESMDVCPKAVIPPHLEHLRILFLASKHERLLGVGLCRGSFGGPARPLFLRGRKLSFGLHCLHRLCGAFELFARLLCII